MKKTCGFAIIIAVIFELLNLTSSCPAQENSHEKRFLIGFKPRIQTQSMENRRNIVRNYGGRVRRSFRFLPAVSAGMPEETATKLINHPDIDYVEEDIMVQVFDQEVPWGVEITGASEVWATDNKGTGINIAILDTGIDYNHPDLARNIAGGVDYSGWYSTDGRRNRRYWDDLNGHGSHCAGVIAALDNNIGVIGIAPEARLWAVKVLDDNGTGYVSDIIQGLEWCVDNGIQIASMSFGGSQYSQTFKNACDEAYNSGVLLVAAAGNGGSVYYPAAYDSVIAVSATDSDDSIASFSSTGSEVEIAAPGVNIISTYSDGQYAIGSGTSMACPHVAGAAALVYASEKLGLISPDEVRRRLRETAVDLGAPGKDNLYGYGRLDAAAAAIPKPVLTTIEVSPYEATLFVGNSQQFTAYGTDQFGDPIDTGTITWQSSNTLVGAIDENGLFTAAAEGTTTITAGNSSAFGTAYVTVNIEFQSLTEMLEFSGTVQPRDESIHLFSLDQPATLYARLIWNSSFDLKLRIYNFEGRRIAQVDRSNRRRPYEEILIDLEAGDWVIAVKSDTGREPIDYIIEAEIMY